MSIQRINSFSSLSDQTVRMERTKNERIKTVALSILTELSASLIVCLTISCFTISTGAVGLLVISLLIQTVVRTFFASLSAISSHYAHPKHPTSFFYLKLAEICQWASALNFSIGCGSNAQILIHESGHSIAAAALYKNGNPSIHILPFKGGFTRYSLKEGLSALGHKIGAKRGEMIITAAGASTGLFVSAALLIGALFIKKKYPTLSKYFIVYALYDLIKHIFYALSAFYTPKTQITNDFVHLSLLGVHPTVAIARMIAVALIIYLGYALFSFPSYIKSLKYL